MGQPPCSELLISPSTSSNAFSPHKANTNQTVIFNIHPCVCLSFLVNHGYRGDAVSLVWSELVVRACGQGLFAGGTASAALLWLVANEWLARAGDSIGRCRPFSVNDWFKRWHTLAICTGQWLCGRGWGVPPTHPALL